MDPLIAHLFLNEAICNIDSSNPSVTYVGVTKPGISEYDPKWYVLKKTVEGSITKYRFSVGMVPWDKRDTQEYA